jgi:hypothetical protein
MPALTDPLRDARAAVRAGRFQDAAVALAELPPEVRGSAEWYLLSAMVSWRLGDFGASRREALEAGRCTAPRRCRRQAARGQRGRRGAFSLGARRRRVTRRCNGPEPAVSRSPAAPTTSATWRCISRSTTQRSGPHRAGIRTVGLRCGGAWIGTHRRRDIMLRARPGRGRCSVRQGRRAGSSGRLRPRRGARGAGNALGRFQWWGLALVRAGRTACWPDRRILGTLRWRRRP